MYDWNEVVKDMADRNILIFAHNKKYILAMLCKFVSITDKLIPELVLATNKECCEGWDIEFYQITIEDLCNIKRIADEMGLVVPRKCGEELIDVSNPKTFSEYFGEIIIVKTSQGYVFGVEASE